MTSKISVMYGSEVVNFLKSRGFRTKYLFYLPPTSNHLHPLQVENCDSNSLLVVDEDYNCIFRLESVKSLHFSVFGV